MDASLELIALLLGEVTDKTRDPQGLIEGAQRLVRSPDGRVALEAVMSREEFDEAARNTGCFRRGTPIRDPSTREVIGYEMEEVLLRRPVAAG